MRKLGFLGGSFDPVHKGHVQLALAAAEALHLDEVRFIPAAQSWQKNAPGANGAARVAMLQLALAQADFRQPGQHTAFGVDQRELQRGGLSYTIDTARELRRESGAEAALFLLLGADQFLNLPAWREWRALFDLVNIAAAGRPGYEMNQAHWPQEIVGACAPRLVDARRGAATKAFGGVHLIDMVPVEAAATDVRARLRAGGATGQQAAQQAAQHAAPLAALLPAPVLDYIERHQLYSS